MYTQRQPLDRAGTKVESLLPTTWARCDNACKGKETTILMSIRQITSDS